jgi:hypothetical protein
VKILLTRELLTASVLIAEGLLTVSALIATGLLLTIYLLDLVDSVHGIEKFLLVGDIDGVVLKIIIDDTRETDLPPSGFEVLILRAEVSNDYTASPICIMSVNGATITGQSMVLTDFIISLQG